MTYSARRDEADAGRIGGACLAFLDRLPRNAAIQAGPGGRIPAWWAAMQTHGATGQGWEICGGGRTRKAYITN